MSKSIREVNVRMLDGSTITYNGETLNLDAKNGVLNFRVLMQNPYAPTTDKFEKKPFYEGCTMRMVTYEQDTVTEALVFCDHKDNPDTCEGNCRKDICPRLKESP